jgi:hypothetical protein
MDLSIVRVRSLARWGLTMVVVNGQVAFEQGAVTAARAGRVLHGPAKTP